MRDDRKAPLGNADWRDELAASEPMRSRTGDMRRRPSGDDMRVRRRMRRSGTVQQEEGIVQTRSRNELLKAIGEATSFVVQAQLVRELDELDMAERRKTAVDREVDFASAVVRETFMPVASKTARSSGDSDWLVDTDDDEMDHTAIVAQAAVWFGKVSEMVRADADEFGEQARGQAHVVTSSLGEYSGAAVQTFVDYATFLRAQAGHKEAASGVPQIQQLTAPDGSSEQATELPQDVFDNFAPPVADINAGVDEQTSSERNPLMQEIMSTPGNSSPEQPGGHSTTDELSWNPEGGGEGSAAPTQNSAPAPSSGAPEQPGGHHDDQAQDEGARRAQAASTLPMIQQTTDTHDAPAATPLPTQVAFPWTMGGEEDGLEGEAHYDTGGEVSSSHQSTARRVRADQWTQPSQGVEPNIANSPASTPPRNVGEAGSGAADAANPEAKPSFGDAHLAPAYTEAYTGHKPAPANKDVPVSMGGDNGQSLKHPAYASRKVASLQEMQHPEFQRGYKYASKWQPTTPLVLPGSPELEAGIYAGFTDRPIHRAAWVALHAELGKVEASLGQRIAAHRQLTHKVAAAQGLPTDGTYLQTQAATGVDLDTTAPGTSPSPTGDTPLNGPGRPGPLAGGMDPSASGGASPYNGAEPLSQPVVPSGTTTAPDPTAQTVPDSGMASGAGVDSLHPTTAAFRRRVQAARLTARQEG